MSDKTVHLHRFVVLRISLSELSMQTYNKRMERDLKLAIIGGGNMAQALASGLIGKRCAVHNVHVVDPNEAVHAHWQQLGVNISSAMNQNLHQCNVWLFAVKPQLMYQVVQQAQQWLQSQPLVISIAAGIPALTLARWLASASKPYTRVVRCMPNTPALIACGITGMMALDGVDEPDRKLAENMLQAVGQVLWVDNDQQIDAVTAVSGSGPAYVFLFLEALISAGIEHGLSAQQARELALSTFNGATQLAILSPDQPAVLRERVTSKGGTTEAALGVFVQHQQADIIRQAVAAAATRAAELASELSEQGR